MWTKAVVVTSAVLALCNAQVPVPQHPPGFTYGDGSAAAGVQLETYIDLLCPASKAAYEGVKSVAEHYGSDDVCVKFVPFPLPYHQYAFTAAEAGFTITAALGDDKFVTWLETMYEKQEDFWNKATKDLTAVQVTDKFRELAKSTFPELTDEEWEKGMSSYGGTDADSLTRISWKYTCTRGVSVDVGAGTSVMLPVAALRHAATGTIVVGGGLTLVQSLLARQLKPPSAFAVSIAVFIGTFRLVEAIERLQWRRRNSPRAAVAAAIICMHLLPKARRGMLLSYAMLEALITLAKELTSLADVKNIELPLGALACSRIIYTWIYNPDLFSKSQLAVLDGLCVIPADVLQRMRDELPSGRAISQCDVFHRGHSCTEFHTAYLRDGFLKSMRIYVPIYLFSAVLSKYKRWLWGPRPSLSQLLIQYLRTCGCLTVSYQIPLFFACVSPMKQYRSTVIVGGLLTALALYIEHKKRRPSVLKAIAVYSVCTTGTLISRHTHMSPGSVRAWQHVLFAAALAIVLQRSDLQSRSFIRWLYGYDPTASPPHQLKETESTSKAPALKSVAGPELPRA
ncbi:TPA: hypothetical protein N0F65_006444 [Lagenidium giganteum]|uniref:Thioredoxin-like fold domain-containing protein n=1 Tax=Lagenidium giganteum TaxID=4803 RepID=A0AAV2Z433_9STRA|nr:TPA: hypothetical protein N0F65_006444 [Lagenidium giganteum]